MFNKALEYEHVLSFTLGEPDFTASENVVEAGCRAIREGKTKYSANAGILELRQAIARYLHRAEGLSYDPASQIIVTAGAMEALFLALKVLLEPGDEVIVNEPCWTNYIQQISMCGGIPVPVAADPQKGFDLDVEKIAQAVTPRTRVIILNSPCNPTGAVASREALEQLAKLAEEHDLVVLADEVYKHILFDGLTYTGFATLPGMQERTLVVDSLSKTYAMTGWRIGYGAGPQELVQNMIKLQENVCNTRSSAATPLSVCRCGGAGGAPGSPGLYGQTSTGFGGTMLWSESKAFQASPVIPPAAPSMPSLISRHWACPAKSLLSSFWRRSRW